MPLLAHTAAFGGTSGDVPSGGRLQALRAAVAAAGRDVAVWTDIPRPFVDAVVRGDAADEIPAAVREFVTWAATERRVRLVNSDEVFHAGRTLPSADALRDLRLADTPESRAAAATLLWQEAAALFGGEHLTVPPLPQSE